MSNEQLRIVAIVLAVLGYLGLFSTIGFWATLSLCVLGVSKYLLDATEEKVPPTDNNPRIYGG